MAKPPPGIPGPLGVKRRNRWLGGFRRRTYPLLSLFGELVPRAVDIAVSASVLALLSPIVLIRVLRSQYQAGSVLTASTLVGRYQAHFRRVSFAGTGRNRALPGSCGLVERVAG